MSKRGFCCFNKFVLFSEDRQVFKVLLAILFMDSNQSLGTRILETMRSEGEASWWWQPGGVARFLSDVSEEKIKTTLKKMEAKGELEKDPTYFREKGINVYRIPYKSSSMRIDL